MKRIRFEVYSTILKEIQELSNEIHKNMSIFGYYDFRARIGFKIGEVEVTLIEGKDAGMLRIELENVINKNCVDNEKEVWLKEVSNEE